MSIGHIKLRAQACRTQFLLHMNKGHIQQRHMHIRLIQLQHMNLGYFRHIQLRAHPYRTLTTGAQGFRTHKTSEHENMTHTPYITCMWDTNQLKI